ncbi:molybdate ABC transporter substrate-binding protein [Salinisphaera sp. SPP-AMP-43]|uniref:molybdate ABC transporter substrate-binding protein n=1 Tax=Salinisphaera sp. SPP-AMP-43 TaxID=3121288 RepID=UPI003C6DD64E
MVTLFKNASRGLLGLATATLIVVGGAHTATAATADSQQPLVVFAAASLKNAMDGVAQAYDASHDGPPVKVSYAGSSTLARQIESGAPADVYVSANQQWMDKLAEDGLIDRASRYDLLGNSLVLIAPKDSDTQVELTQHMDLAAALGDHQYLAMANTDAVPAGIYGKHALQWLDVWSQMQGHIAQGDDVRAALALVSRGESPLGVVYSSDAVADQGVRVVDTFPSASHKPIIYPAAATADSDNPQDAEFLGYLKSDQARKIFKRWGFKVVAKQ